MNRLDRLTLFLNLLIAGGAVCSSYAYPAAPEQIQMKSITFAPKKIEVIQGQAVVWKNVSLTQHSATSISPTSAEQKKFDTGLIAPGHVSSPVIFDQAGDYRYQCSIHGKTMSGEIVVRAGAK